LSNNRKKKILILTVLAGMGHIRAAEAISEGIHKIDSEAIVWLHDPMEDAQKIRMFINNFYIWTVRYAPVIWGFLYNSRIISSRYSPIRWYITKKYIPHVKNNIQRFKPDIIVSTHPFIAAAVGKLKKSQEINIPLVSVATDFHVHPFGINSQVDVFIVPCKEVYEYLKANKIPGKKIIIEGIPISPKFSIQNNDTITLRKKLGLKKEYPVVLILSGGFGLMPVIEVINVFRDIPHDKLQLVIIVGKDKRLENKIKEKVADFQIPVKVFGFVNNMEEFMSVAELVITKPGGMSVSEALVKRVPLILMHAIRGQEMWNVDILTNAGAAIYPKHVKDIPEIVLRLLYTEKECLQNMKNVAMKLEKPNCAINIGKFILDMIT
jgi:processive 1,2-diacylglycerol beta-glucosyltransferase